MFNTKGMEILSQCCATSVKEDFKGNDNDTPLVEIYTCTGCNKECDTYDDKPEYHTGDLPDEPTLPGEDDYE